MRNRHTHVSYASPICRCRSRPHASRPDEICVDPEAWTPTVHALAPSDAFGIGFYFFYPNGESEPFNVRWATDQFQKRLRAELARALQASGIMWTRGLPNISPPERPSFGAVPSSCSRVASIVSFEFDDAWRNPIAAAFVEETVYKPEIEGAMPLAHQIARQISDKLLVSNPDEREQHRLCWEGLLEGRPFLPFGRPTLRFRRRVGELASTHLPLRMQCEVHSLAFPEEEEITASGVREIGELHRSPISGLVLILFFPLFVSWYIAVIARAKARAFLNGNYKRTRATVTVTCSSSTATSEASPTFC